MRFLRRLFAFAFRHDWAVLTCERHGHDFWTVLKCKGCGVEASYPTLNKDWYIAMYRATGCPGTLAGKGGERGE